MSFFSIYIQLEIKLHVFTDETARTTDRLRREICWKWDQSSFQKKHSILVWGFRVATESIELNYSMAWTDFFHTRQQSSINNTTTYCGLIGKETFIWNALTIVFLFPLNAVLWGTEFGKQQMCFFICSWWKTAKKEYSICDGMQAFSHSKMKS